MEPICVFVTGMVNIFLNGWGDLLFSDLLNFTINCHNNISAPTNFASKVGSCRVLKPKSDSCGKPFAWRLRIFTEVEGLLARWLSGTDTSSDPV
jgi:hypothetical protein